MESYVKQEENICKYENLMELANGYEIQVIKNDVESDEKEGGETGEPERNKIRRNFRKFGLKKMERNIKEGKHTGIIKNLM